MTLLFGAPAAAAAQQDGWSPVVGARAGVYAPSAAIFSRTYTSGWAEAEVGYSPQFSVEVGLATGSPATVVRLVAARVPSLDLVIWRRACGRGPICSLGTAKGGITTFTAEIAAAFTSPFQDWDMAFVGGVGGKRYGWSEPQPPCDEVGGTPAECEDARGLWQARTVFTIHLGIEATYPVGRHHIVFEAGDYLSTFGVRTEGAARGQFQNDLVAALGVRLRPM